MIRWFSMTTVGALVALLSCSGEQAFRPSPRASLLEGVTATRAYRTPATWRYHPTEEAELRARIELSDGRVLYAGGRGERWLVDPRTKRAEAAAGLAPEDLGFILESRKQAWLFVGESGTVYEADEPLGPFLRSSAPLDPLVRVTAGGSAIVGVRRDGSLLRSDDAGASWRPVGPDTAKIGDAALSDDGAGLALAIPEELWLTRDHGATWSSLSVPTIGAYDLERDGRGTVFVRTAFGLRALRTEGEPALVEPTGELSPRRYEIEARIPLGPSAAALFEGRAAVHGDRYYEARRGQRNGQWLLVSGAVDGALERRPLGVAKGCRDTRLSGYLSVLTLACVRARGAKKTQPVELYRSEDRGKSWVSEPYITHGQLGELTLAAGPDGALLVSGVCPEQASGAGCSPQGVQYRRALSRDGGAKPELAPAATPALVGSAMRLAFSVDGRRAFAIGRRSKSRALSVFVSRDAGHTFEAHDIEQLTVPEDESKLRRSQANAIVIESAVAAEDGSMAFVVRRYSERSLLVTDDEGRVLALSVPPVKGARIGAAGSRAVAVAVGSRETFESLDGGASWEPVGRLPVDLCPDDPDCNELIHCHPGGCVIGDLVSRIGWRGQADEPEALLLPARTTTSRFAQPKVKAPYSCALDEQQSWRAAPPRTTVPTADQAMIGDVAWFALSHDPDEASVSVLHAFGGASPRIEETRLFGPVRGADKYAYALSMQVEGAAALRYVLPGEGGRGANISRVEVAWDNRLEGRTARAILPDAGPYRPGDFEKTKGLAQRARPDLMSIAAGGIYVRPHSAPGDNQPTYFLDGRSVEVVPPVVWPKNALEFGRSEMAHIGGEHVPWRIGFPMVRARRAGSGWEFDALMPALREPVAFGLDQAVDIAYAGGRSGLHLTVSDRRGRSAFGALHPFQATGALLGPAVRAPTQLDLAETPRRCSRFQATETPRVVVPYQPGTRHPVLVTDAMDAMRILLTASAVMGGTPSAPCVAAFEAEIVALEGSGKTQHERALIFPGDLEHGWLFRIVEQEAGGPRLEYRTMSCRIEPDAQVPLEVYRAKGTAVY